jgi:hypothetical protein
MAESKKEKMLNDPQVKLEIAQYKWIESEKVGYDIGFDKAAEDWFKLHAKAWEAQHSSPVKKSARKAKKV